MSFLQFTNIVMGSFNGIATYKQKPIDNILLVGYYTIITPISMIKVYSNIPLENRLRYNGYPMFFATLLSATAVNGAIFGLGHIVGKTAYSTLYS